MSTRIEDNNLEPELDLASVDLESSVEMSVNADKTQLIPQLGQTSGKHVVDVRVGSLLKNRFILESVIAKGGMGVVYKARDIRKIEAHDSNPYVAIKLLNKKFSARKNALITLQRETRKSQILAHPNIINVHDFDRDDDVFLMTMEYLQGKPLSKIIKPKGKPIALPFDEALRIIESISNALIYAHSKNIVHCDLKPANIFMTDEKLVKILDFGIARAIQVSDVFEVDESLNQGDGLNALTLTYASCEMIEGETPEPRDDIYSLACICYQLLTGRHPFARKSAVQARDQGLKPEVIKSLTHRQWRVLSAALSFKRELRPATVKEYIQEFLPVKHADVVKTWVLPVAGILALVVALVLYQGNYLVSPEVEIVTVPFTELLQSDQEKVLSLLEIADAHMMVQRYTEPPGSNAHVAYSQVLDIHPGNPQALVGLSRIADVYARLAQDYFDKGQVSTASNLIDEGLKISGRHERLLQLQDEVQ